MTRHNRLPGAFALLGLIGVYGLLVRPRLMRWGADEDEVEEVFAGENLVSGGVRGATMATTLSAPPSATRPWLVQMGCDRAGWYSVDRLDDGGRPSADRIHPEWQHLSVGDRLASTPSGSAWFVVAVLEPERVLVLRASFDLRGRPYTPGGSPPRWHSDSTWGFTLHELPGERTRLVVSGYATGRPKAVLTALNVVFWEPSHWIMQRAQFANIEKRVAASEPAPRAGGA